MRCEKPMALDLASCDRMIAACRASGVRLGIAYYCHFDPLVLRMREILNTGEIGRPFLAEVLAFEWFDPPADFEARWRLSCNPMRISTSRSPRTSSPPFARAGTQRSAARRAAKASACSPRSTAGEALAGA
jgi:hypothetical protein